VASRNRGGTQAECFALSHYDAGALVGAVADVAREASAPNPGSVSTRAFDRARAAAGHPQCPTAKVICHRLRMSWPEVKLLALDPARCVDRSLGSRLSEADAGAATAAEMRLALRTTAARLGVATLSGAQYMRERARMLESDRRCYRHGRKLVLPTEAQILVAAGSWAHALALAGLSPLTHDRSQTTPVSVVDALDLFADEYGYVATTSELEGFAVQRDLPLARRRRPFAEDVAAVRALRAARGEETAEQRPSKEQRPVFEPAAAGVTARRKKRWSDAELVAALVAGFDLVPPRTRLTQENYRRHCAHRPGFPPVSAFSRIGRPGFSSYRARARAERQASESRSAVSGRAA
jgi:hypothetical protein